MTTSKRSTKLSAVEAVAGDRDLMKALMKEALQEVLEGEMTEFPGSQPGERTEARNGYRAGYYGRNLVTRIGKLELRAMQEELIDRYGEMPAQTQALMETHRLRLAGRALGLAKLDAGPAVISLQFVPKPPIDPADIILLIQSDRSFKLAGPDKLTWQKPTAALRERVAAVKELFRRLKR